MKAPFIPLLLMSVLFSLPVYGQVVPNDSTFAIADSQDFKMGLFDNDELFKIFLRFDITYYMKKKPVEENLDAVLTYYISDNDSINKNIKLRARGNFRRTFCAFPPLRLNFRINDSDNEVFGGIDKLKLVPHCKIGFETYILKEYLIYRLYNALTDNSLRVRLLEINYINTHKKKKPIKEYGFAIEPIELYEKRTGTFENVSTTLTQKNIMKDVMDRLAIFQYMIGNTDWSVPNLHNIQVFSKFDSRYPISGVAVPYDFDYCGLVDAPYALPFEELPIQSVRDRLYLGICRDEEVILKAVQEFVEKKDEFYGIINGFPYLSVKTKKQMISYLNGFYGKLDKRNTLVYDMLKSCKDF
jgi:hypothetical protein